MNRVAFVFLLVLFLMSWRTPIPALTLGLTMAKALIVAFVYMELWHAHRIWQFGFLFLVMFLFGTLILLA